jgi:two-component sensor histidine kinase
MHGLSHIGGPLKIGEVMAVVHPDDLPRYRKRLVEAKGRSAPSTNEYRVIHPDGSIRWIYAKGRPLFAADGRPSTALGIVIDLTERKATEERLGLLMREVDHRANNLMAVIQGAVTLSRSDDPGELRQIIIGRVEALARAHQLLAESRWRGADLRRLVEEELRPFALGDEARVRVEGPPLPLSPAAAQGVAMALHELATNAAKHGALSAPGGHVAVAWKVDDERLRICWSEAGGPPVNTPTKAGFGGTVLQRALSGSVGGRTQLHWRAQGLVCELELPLTSLTALID